MNKNKKIAVASGIIKGETQSYVRGSGRIHRASYFDLIKKYPNPKFPLNTEKLFKTCPFNEND